MTKVNIITLGCSKNTVDSENVAGHLLKKGLEITFDKNVRADVVVVNTCGFIGDAKEESVRVILEQAGIKKRRRKPMKLFVCGCLVERYREELKSEIPEIDGFYGVHQWEEMIDDIAALKVQQFEEERFISTPKHYAYLKIAEGCNRRCSYCAIPFIRGKYVSRPMESLIDEAKQLVENGVKELIIIAQDTTYYGVDLYGRQCLAELLEKLALHSGAKWIRLHYTFPTNFPLDVLDVMKRYDNICKYLDIPLQHIDTKILSSMNRGIDEQGTLQLLDTIREKVPEMYIRTSLIVGYPGETEEKFQKLVDFVKSQRFERLGVFTYSSEEGTASAQLPDDIPQEEKERRLEEIMTVQEGIVEQQNEKLMETEIEVLIDRREGEYWVGRTQYDSPEVDTEVTVNSHFRLKKGEFYKVYLNGFFDYDLEGDAI
ncbi:MAG: 30S ribosomal protein S12 methylthiotransferase RimO [Bacteroidales bacterium]|nr:30S ribosomal protein S12 methylthiotransferase RimO [Bacteroidales bacterium]